MRSLLLFALLVLWGGLTAQINVTNNFDSGLNGWVQSGGGSTSTDRACNGSQSFQDNLWVSSRVGSLSSPAASNTSGGAVTIDFTYKIQDFNSDDIADPYDGTVSYGYSLNGGTTVPLGTLTPTATCTPVSAAIPAGTLTAGDAIVFRFNFTWGTTGDWEIYLDDFSASQPGFCVQPSANYTVVEDCANNQFTVDVVVTDAGSATTLTISDDQGSVSQAADLVDPNTFGPYPSGTNVVFTVTNDQNVSCFLISPAQMSACPPPNNDCAGAEPLFVSTDGTCSSPQLGTNVNTTPSGETPNPDCSLFGNGNDNWYSVTVPISGNLVIEMTSAGGPTDWGMQVYTGVCGSLALLECDDDDGDGSFPLVDLSGLTPNEVLLVRVFEYGNNSSGDFNICAHTILCENPTVSYTITEDCSSDQFTVDVEVTDPGSATSLTINDDQGSASQTADLVTPNTFGPYPSGTSVVFTTTNDQDGACSVASSAQTFFCPLANDECDQAVALTVGTGVEGTITRATDSGVNLCSGAEDDDVWYSFVATSTTHFIEIADNNSTSNFDFFHTILSGDCENLTAVECSDDDNSTTNGLTVGELYYVQVYSWTSAPNQQADFIITVTSPPPPPANDACENAIALTDASGMPTVASGATYNSNSADPAQSSPAQSCGIFSGNADDDLWFTVTAPNGAGDMITIEADGNPDLVITLYSGDCDNLVQVDCSDSGNPETINYLVPAARGAGSAPQTYLVQVFTYVAGGGIFTVSASVALPVDLVSFSGQAMEKANKISWVTAREEAADRYVVERSSNAGDEWSAIGTTYAAGNSSTALHYELMDENPLATAYYRLRMVDLDGTFTFSNIVELKNNTIDRSGLGVYPVPAAHDATLSFTALAEGQATITLTDLTGRTISERVVRVTSGQNFETIDLQARVSGVYLVRVNVDGHQMVRRVIKR